MSINILAIVQARANSKRLPNKVLKKINGKSIIEILLNRLSQSKTIDKIVLSTGKDRVNDELENLVENLGFDVFRGSNNDVLSRFYYTALKYNAKSIVRITGDCPLTDYTIVDSLINYFKSNNIEYASNTNPPTFPDGLDVEAFSFSALKEAFHYSDGQEREHVTPYMVKNHKLKKYNLINNADLSLERWTVDYQEDFILIKNILKYFKMDLNFHWSEVLKLKSIKPELFNVNKNFSRNEGVNIGSGQKLYSYAKKIIPGGTMLFSKRAEQYLPKKWPTYFSKTMGVRSGTLMETSFLIYR